MSGFAAALAGLAVGSFMLYFPYWWCRRKGEREEDWGLAWFMGPRAWRDTILALVLTLAPLTVVSLHWPHAWGGTRAALPLPPRGAEPAGRRTGRGVHRGDLLPGLAPDPCRAPLGTVAGHPPDDPGLRPLPSRRDARLAEAGDLLPGARDGDAAPPERLRAARHRLPRALQRLGRLVGAPALTVPPADPKRRSLPR